MYIYVLFVWGIPIAVVSRDGTPKIFCSTSSVSLSHIQNSGQNPGMFGMVNGEINWNHGNDCNLHIKYDIIYVCVVEEVVRNILGINNSKDWTCLKASSFNGGEIKIHIEHDLINQNELHDVRLVNLSSGLAKKTDENGRATDDNRCMSPCLNECHIAPAKMREELGSCLMLCAMCYHFMLFFQPSHLCLFIHPCCV